MVVLESGRANWQGEHNRFLGQSLDDKFRVSPASVYCDFLQPESFA